MITIKQQLIGVLIFFLVVGLFPGPSPTRASTAPPRPMILSPSDEVYYYKLPLSVTFQPLAGATSYTITVWDSLELTKKLEKTISGTSLPILSGDLPQNQFYYVSVRANYPNQVVSDESFRVPFFLDNGAKMYPPERPTLLNPMQGDQVSLPLRFRWAFQSSASYYELVIWDQYQLKKIITQIVRGKKHTIPAKLLPGDSYYYASIRASYANGSVSDESERVHFYVNPDGEAPPEENPPGENPGTPPSSPTEPKEDEVPTILTPLSHEQIMLPLSGL